jgi:hypothetical protein
LWYFYLALPKEDDNLEVKLLHLSLLVFFYR